MRVTDSVDGCRILSHSSFTAAALKGVPSLNFTPGRSVRVQLMPSLVVKLSAIRGWMLPVGLMVNRLS